MGDENIDQLALVRSLRNQKTALETENKTLKKGGPGGTSGGMDVVDSKIAAAEARTDTKFAELRGDLAKFATKGTVWTAVGTLGGTILAVMLAVAAFGGDRFDAGMSASSAFAPFAAAQRDRDAAQDKKFDEILRRLPPAKVDPAEKK
jgi:hypothetical protein